MEVALDAVVEGAVAVLRYKRRQSSVRDRTQRGVLLTCACLLSVGPSAPEPHSRLEAWVATVVLAMGAFPFSVSTLFERARGDFFRIARGEGIRPPQGACKKPPKGVVSVVDQDEGDQPSVCDPVRPQLLAVPAPTR